MLVQCCMYAHIVLSLSPCSSDENSPLKATILCYILWSPAASGFSGWEWDSVFNVHAWPRTHSLHAVTTTIGLVFYSIAMHHLYTSRFIQKTHQGSTRWPHAVTPDAQSIQNDTQVSTVYCTIRLVFNSIQMMCYGLAYHLKSPQANPWPWLRLNRQFRQHGTRECLYFRFLNM